MIEVLGSEYQLTFKDWEECDYITLGMGGETLIEEGRHYHVEYVPMLEEEKVLSEDAYRVLTGQEVDVKPGTYMNLIDEEETSLYSNNTAKEFTNMVTRQQMDIEFAGFLHCDFFLQVVFFGGRKMRIRYR